MKKNFLLGFIAFAAMAVTSCTNDEMNEFIPQGKAIEFNTYVGRDAQARGTETTPTTLQTSGFGVIAYQHTGSPSYTAAPNFMDNVKVSTASWTYTAPTKYWPTDKRNKIDFFAYGPYSDGTNIDVDKNTLTFTVDPTVENQTDLVVATPAKNQYYISNSDKNTGNNGTVNFEFAHMLSRIAFYAKAAGTYASTITVTNISLTGKFHGTGTVDLAAASPSITGTDVSVETAKTYQPALSGTALSTTFAMQNKNTDYLMLIPAAAQDLSLSITYTVKDNDNTVVTNTLTKSISQAFVAGTAYAINLSVSLNDVKFSVQDFSWGAETAVPNSGTIEF